MTHFSNKVNGKIFAPALTLIICYKLLRCLDTEQIKKKNRTLNIIIVHLVSYLATKCDYHLESPIKNRLKFIYFVANYFIFYV